MKSKSENAPGRWEIIAGFITAILVNVFIYWLTQRAAHLHLDSTLWSYINLLPWIVNGLFLLVFLVILPRFALGYLGFALGYLAAAALIMAIPMLAAIILVAGCFLIVAVVEFLPTITTPKTDQLPMIISGTAYVVITLMIILVLYFKNKKKNE